MKKLFKKVRSARKWLTVRACIRVLCNPTPPSTINSEARFEELQRAHPPRPEYGYDLKDFFARASQRVSILGEKSSRIFSQRLRGIEIGSGDGLLGKMLTDLGHEIVLNDIEDWRCPAARNTPLVLTQPDSTIPFEKNTFDFAFSFNAFEHLQDPAKTLSEILRILKPGGFCYLSFGPLYASPWGLHAYRSLRMPYPQFIFDSQYIKSKIQQIGISDLGKSRAALQYTNGWKVQDYEKLFSEPENISASITKIHDFSHLSAILKHRHCFSGRGLSIEDVTCTTLNIYLVKNK